MYQMKNKSTIAYLSIDNQVVAHLPIMRSSLGKSMIDISGLSSADYFIFDPGYKHTAAFASSLTYINGQQGQLLYRGYDVGQLADTCDYLSTCHMLLEGDLGDTPSSAAFAQSVLDQQSNIDIDALSAILKAMDASAHPMAMMITLLGAFAGQHPHYNHPDASWRIQALKQGIAVMPILAAMCYRHTCGLDVVKPDPNKHYAQNFLYMMFAHQHDAIWNDTSAIDAIDRIMMLHLDHEQNASTSTVRMAGSTGAHPFACLASGMAALWGAAHGGANEACLAMLKAIGDIAHVDDVIARAKDPQDDFRLMGFGHRVYKSYDPRAKVMQRICHGVLQARGKTSDPLFRLAKALESIALKDPYFIEKKLYPNVDFYSGITQHALGIPPNMFTVIFGVARAAGWLIQWHEMMGDAQARLCRPRQHYTGPKARSLPSRQVSEFGDL